MYLSIKIYGTAQFKLDNYMHLLVELLKKFHAKFMSCTQAHV